MSIDLLSPRPTKWTLLKTKMQSLLEQILAAEMKFGKSLTRHRKFTVFRTRSKVNTILSHSRCSGILRRDNNEMATHYNKYMKMNLIL